MHIRNSSRIDLLSMKFNFELYFFFRGGGGVLPSFGKRVQIVGLNPTQNPFEITKDQSNTILLTEIRFISIKSHHKMHTAIAK